MSETTSTRSFRGNLKYYFDLAHEEPVVINRGEDRYVLLHEDEFAQMKEEVSNLQKSLISALQNQNAEGEVVSDSDEESNAFLKEFLNKNKSRKKSKKKGA